MIFDVHAHLYPPGYLERLTAADLGPIVFERVEDSFRFTLGGRHFVTFTRDFYDPDLRVDVMRQDGIDMQALTLAPPMVFWAERDFAAMLCRLTNDYLAEVAQSYPEQFVAGAVVPLQHPDLAVEELRRAVEDLGHRMVLFGTNIHDVQLDDPMLEPVWTEIERLDVPIYVHPIKPAGMECMHEYRLDIAVGFPTDTTLAATRVVLGGVLHRHPGLRFCWAHMGGSLLWLADRIDMVRGRIPRADAQVDDSLRDHLSRFWFDTTVPAQRNLRYGVEVVGADRLMFGTDMPFFGNLTHELLDVVRAAPFLEDKQRDAILGANAKDFLALT